MKEGWEYKKLGDIATYINGFPFKPSDWKDKGKPIIRIQNLTNPQSAFNRCPRTDIPEKYFVSYGDILISWSATLGVFEWTLEDALLNQHIFKVVFDKVAINKQYFRYAIMTSISEMSRHTNGATMKHIRKGDFDNIRIPYPPISEQQSIVDYLDSAFAKIDAMKANAEKALNEAKALFQASLKEMLEPKEGWEKKTIGELTESCLGKMLDKHKNRGDFKPYLRNLNVRWDGFDLEDILEMRFEEGEDDRYGIKEGDLIICEGGEPGRCAIWGNQIVNMKIQKALHRVRSKGEIINRFLLFSIMLYSWNDFLRNYESGTTIKHLTGEALKKIPISYPPLTVQHTTVATLDSLKSKVDLLQANYDKISQECDALKQAILRKVFE